MLTGKMDGSSFEYLSQLYDGLSTIDQLRLSRLVESEGADSEVSTVLSDMFSSSESKWLNNDFYPTKEEASQITLCLSKNRLVLELMSLMADSPEYRFQMGVLLSVVDFSDLPVRLKRQLHVDEKGSNQKLWPKNKSWYLCDAAEPRLVDAMFDGGVLLVNENLLVKFNGKLSAVCIRSFTTKDGFTFLRGNWYSPTDQVTIDFLEEVYKSGKVEINLEFDSEWALMRPVFRIAGNTQDDLVNEAAKISKKLAGKRRREFSLEAN